MNGAFAKALEEVLRFEGGYANDPDDKGGETFRGISRKAFPRWEGWGYIDSVKGQKNFTAVLEQSQILKDLTEKFYYENFWTKIHGDKIPSMIATEIFEQAVNLGTKQATKHLQEALNILNQNQRFYADIKTDGIFGPQTMDALDKCMEVYANLKLLYNVLNILQGKYYITLMKRTPKFEKYIGWFTRINCGRTK